MTRQRSGISNFEYLMYLNTLADVPTATSDAVPSLPMDPADYHSQTLDLTNPAVFVDSVQAHGATDG
uniref:Uncharacterized protein n=1 Tax=Sphaerodactylus townsendi TaxID=933632 RepID=A0ACB8F7Q0_9SAUR